MDEQIVMTYKSYNFSAFLSLVAKLILPEQMELIKYKSVSIKYYDRVCIFALIISMQITSFLCYIMLDHLWPVLTQLYFL